MKKLHYERGNRMDYNQKRFFPDFPLTLLRDMNLARRRKFTLETVNRFLAKNGRIELLNFANVNAPGGIDIYEKGMDHIVDFFIDFSDYGEGEPYLTPEQAFCYDLGLLCKRMAVDRWFDLTLFSNDIETTRQPYLAIQPTNESLFQFIATTDQLDLAIFLSQAAFYWLRRFNVHDMNKPLADYLEDTIDLYDEYLADGEIPKCEYIRQACRIASVIREHDNAMRKLGLSQVAADFVDLLNGCYLYYDDIDPDYVKAAKKIEELAKAIPQIDNASAIASYLSHLISHDDIILFSHS